VRLLERRHRIARPYMPRAGRSAPGLLPLGAGPEAGRFAWLTIGSLSQDACTRWLMYTAVVDVYCGHNRSLSLAKRTEFAGGPPVVAVAVGGPKRHRGAAVRPTYRGDPLTPLAQNPARRRRPRPRFHRRAGALDACRPDRGDSVRAELGNAPRAVRDHAAPQLRTGSDLSVGLRWPIRMNRDLFFEVMVRNHGSAKRQWSMPPRVFADAIRSVRQRRSRPEGDSCRFCALS